MKADLPELKPGLYRHFKGGLYEVLEVAYHSESLEGMVVYRALYGERALWTRPWASWSTPVELEDGPRARFEIVDEA